MYRGAIDVITIPNLNIDLPKTVKHFASSMRWSQVQSALYTLEFKTKINQGKLLTHVNILLISTETVTLYNNSINPKPECALPFPWLGT